MKAYKLIFYKLYIWAKSGSSPYPEYAALFAILVVEVIYFALILYFLGFLSPSPGYLQLKVFFLGSVLVNFYIHKKYFFKNDKWKQIVKECSQMKFIAKFSGGILALLFVFSSVYIIYLASESNQVQNNNNKNNIQKERYYP